MTWKTGRIYLVDIIFCMQWWPEDEQKEEELPRPKHYCAELWCRRLEVRHLVHLNIIWWNNPEVYASVCELDITRQRMRLKWLHSLFPFFFLVLLYFNQMVWGNRVTLPYGQWVKHYWIHPYVLERSKKCQSSRCSPCSFWFDMLLGLLSCLFLSFLLLAWGSHWSASTKEQIQPLFTL